MRKPLLLLVFLLHIVWPAQAQDHFRKENAALLGIVSIEKDKQVVVAHVLKKSPAQKAKCKVGDVLIRIGTETIKRHSDVDRVLSENNPGDKVILVVRRARAEMVLKAKLMARRKYKGAFLKPMTRGKKNFKAPPWFAFAWGNLAEGEKAPTRLNTEGKVVVFHTFQSW